ncbi:MAG TPA: ATP-binding protein [Planctomycetota bacterium]|nr:ATP-binding protein [Planctomycetota bacterium]
MSHGPGAQAASERVPARQTPNEDILRLFIDTVTDYAIFLLDADGCVTSWNRGAEKIKGYKAEEIIGKSFSTFYPPEVVRTGKCEYELKVAAETGRFEEEGFRVRKDGSRFWASVVITALRDEAGRLRGFGKVTRDLTERKRNEEALRETEALRRAQEALKGADRRKDEFLAMLSHELRNPLAPMSTALELLKLRVEAHDSELARPLSVLSRQTQYLRRLVDDLLEVSRITQGKIRLEKEPLDAATVVKRAAEVSRPLIDSRKHGFEVVLPAEPVWIEADVTRLVQALSNLLNNAAKYTGDGGRIRLSLESEPGEAVFRVADNGIGISSDLMPRLFQLFMQAESSLDRSQGGLGIGLTVVRALVELHGGRVEARSDGPGRGSEFFVRVPALSERPGRRTPTSAVARSRRAVPSRIVVVDDNVDAAESLADFLAESDHDVRVAHDGVSAISAVRAHAPRVVLLDLDLPRVDGYAVARLLRDEHGSAIVLVALTGHGQPEDRHRTREAGFDDHLVKPLDVDALEALLARVCGGTG